MSARHRLALAVALLAAGPAVVASGPILSGMTTLGLVCMVVGLAVVQPLLCDPSAGVTVADVIDDVTAER